MKFRRILQNFAEFSENFGNVLQKIEIAELWIPKAVQRSALRRSRRELSNAYLLAKFGVDTAENEACEVCPIEPSRAESAVGADGPSGGAGTTSME